MDQMLVRIDRASVRFCRQRPWTVRLLYALVLIAILLWQART